MLYSLNIAKEHYPFGMQIQERSHTSIGEDYRFGFNGKENDNEVKGGGNSLDFGARIYDSRLGKWLSEDPKGSNFPFESPFTFVSDNPIIYIDPNGESKYVVFIHINEQTGKTTTFTVLVDADILKVVPVSIPNSMSRDEHWEYDYYDINEVHTTVIKKDGTLDFQPVRVERGAKRAHTWYKSEYWANYYKDESILEKQAEQQLTGIRWTTSSKYGRGNSITTGRTQFIRSENLDDLLGVLQFAHSIGGALSAAELKNLPKSLDDVIERVDDIADVREASQAFESLKKKVDQAQQYDKNGRTCTGCSGKPHDRIDTKDKAGNRFNGQTGDTLR